MNYFVRLKNIQLKKFLKFGNLLAFLGVAFSVFSFFMIIINRSPNFLRQTSMLVQFRPYLTLPVFSALIYLTLGIKRQNLREIIVLFIILVLFALSLAGLWANTHTENFILAGLLPRSDASQQYSGALKLLDFGELNGTASRRPFFAELLAVLLALSGRNLQLSIGFLVLLNAVAIFLGVLMVDKTTNRLSSILFLVMAFLYYARFVGSTMTENLGFLLGSVSLALFLGSLNSLETNLKQSRLLFYSAIFVFSLAQNARPGAIFTIPFLVLLAIHIFHEKEKKTAWRITIIAAICALLPFLINTLHFWFNGFKGSMPMSNMALGLYGFVKGGEKWNQVFADNPGINNLPALQQNSAMFKLIIQEVINNPQNFVKGFAMSFKTLMEPNSPVGLLSFLQFDSPVPNFVFSAAVIVLYAIGIFNLFSKKKSALKLLIAAVIAGFIISFPFAPPYQTMYLRVYAATLPFLILIPVHGLHFLIGKIGTSGKPDHRIENINKMASWYSALVAGLLVFSPLWLSLIKNTPPVPVSTCPPGLKTSLVYYHPSSVINIREDDRIFLDWVPDIHQERFRLFAHNICCEDDIAFYKSLSAPVTLLSAVDSLDGNISYSIVAATGDLPQHPGWLQFCGTVVDIYRKPAESGFFFPEQVNVLNRGY